MQRDRNFSPLEHIVRNRRSATRAPTRRDEKKEPEGGLPTLRLLRKIPGYASLPACSLGQRPIDQNQSPQNLRRSVPRSGSYRFVFLRDCTLEAMRTQGAFSFFQGVATRCGDMLLRSFGGEFGGRPVTLSALDAAGEFDFVARHFAFVKLLDRGALTFTRHGKRDFVAADFPVRNRRIALPARHRLRTGK